MPSLRASATLKRSCSNPAAPPPAPSRSFGLDYLGVSYGASSAVVDASNLCVNVSVALSNSAPVAGLYVVQVYFSQSLSRYARFQRMLAGFAKVAVPAGPGGAAQASVSIPYTDMAHWDPIGQQMFLEAGEYTITVCTSSDEATCAKANTHSIVVPQTVAGL